DPGPHAVAQLQVARQEVGMEVREENVLDPAAELLDVGDVLVDVSLRIDDRRDPGLLVGHEVRSVSQAAEVVLLQYHVPTIAPEPALERPVLSGSPARIARRYASTIEGGGYG